MDKGSRTGSPSCVRRSFKELAIFLRDSSGHMTAGIYAFTWGGCLDIDLLLGHKIGRRLGQKTARFSSTIAGVAFVLLGTLLIAERALRH